jgi:hypothetical protein
VTTRFLNIALYTAGERLLTVPELTGEHGLQLLERLAPAVVKAETACAQRLVQLVGGLPLALVLIGQYLRLEAHHCQPRRLHLALAWLYQPENRLHLEQPLVALARSAPDATLSLQASIALSDQYLSEQARVALRQLAVFPAWPATFSELAALAVTGVSVEVFDQLSDAGLLESRGLDRYSLHPCIADYALLHTENQCVEYRFVRFFARFLDINQDERQLIEQERMNIVAAQLFAQKHNMLVEQERIRAVCSRYSDSWAQDDLLSDARLCLSPYLISLSSSNTAVCRFGQAASAFANEQA